MKMVIIHVFVLCLCACGALTETRVSYNVEEKQSVGSVIGNVKSDAGLADLYDTDELSQLEFNVLSGKGGRKDGSRYFMIGKYNGILELSSIIDRDSLCMTRSSCPLTFDVAVGPRQFIQIITVHIEVLDRNDHTPVFPELSVVLKIPESSPPGTVFSLPAARDGDGEVYSIIAYSMDPQFTEFEIRAEPNTREALNLDLAVMENLDRESRESYVFTITAIDGGNPSLTGAMAVEIVITDTNDNYPVFDKDQYVADISEGMMVQSTLLRVHAQDLDDGENAAISYGFTSSTNSFYGDTFTINEETGDIVLNKALDREIEPEYELTVTALDGGSNSRLATSNVLIRVSDVNDNRPDISINTLTLDGLAKIPESADIGAFVALVTVDDPDQAQNGNVVCSLSSHEFTLSLIQEDKYKIVTRKKLDREEVSEYTVDVRCHDNGSPMLTSQVTVIIKVLDSNDNPPEFVRSSYRVEIIENNVAGSYVIQVNATDLDLDESGEVRYRLKNDINNLFEINSRTGRIVTKGSLNHEASSNIELIVEAFDLGKPSLSSTATVYIDILDINDEKPTFHHSAPTYIFEENSAIGSEVGFLEALDPDSAPYNEIRYSLAPTDDEGIVFDVDEESGRITSRQVLDREAKSVYYLKATAGNPGYTHMTSTVTITIYISDQNDNAPVIDYPSVSNSTIYLSNKYLRDDLVTRIRAHDLDTGENATLVYSIVQNDDSAQHKLRVDSSSGAVFLDTDLSQIEYEKYPLRAVVKDKGKPSHASTIDFMVVVDSTLPPPGSIVDGRQSYDNDNGDDTAKTNLTVVVIVVAVSAVFIIILIVAIVFVVCKGKNDTKRDRPMRIEQFEGKPQIFYEVGKSDTLANKGAIALENRSIGHHSSEWDPNASSNRNSDCFDHHVTYRPDVIPQQKRPKIKGHMSSFKEDPGSHSDESSESGEISNADSGRGGSEEGENHNAHRNHNDYHTQPRTRSPPNSSNNSLPLPPRANRPGRSSTASPVPNDIASVRPGMRTLKLRDKYERQREYEPHDPPSYTLLQQNPSPIDRTPSRGRIDMSSGHIV